MTTHSIPIGQNLLEDVSTRWTCEDLRVRASFQAERDEEKTHMCRRLQQLEDECQFAIRNIDLREQTRFTHIKECRQGLLRLSPSYASIVWSWWSTRNSNRCDEEETTNAYGTGGYSSV